MAAATVGASLLGRRKRATLLLGLCERASGEDGSPVAQWYLGLARTAVAFILDNDFARCHEEAMDLEHEWYAAGRGPGWETDVAMHFSLASQQMLGDVRELDRRVTMLAHNGCCWP